MNGDLYEFDYEEKEELKEIKKHNQDIAEKKKHDADVKESSSRSERARDDKEDRRREDRERRGRSRDRDTERDRDRSRERDRDSNRRNRSRDRSRERDRDRSRERRSFDRERTRGRSKDRERDHDRDRKREGEKTKEHDDKKRKERDDKETRTTEAQNETKQRDEDNAAQQEKEREERRLKRLDDRAKREAADLELIAQKKADFQEYREGLPAYQYKDKIIQEVEKNQVVIITGDTGSGKSTQIPQLVYDFVVKPMYKEGEVEKIVGVTQPRRVGAVSLANRVAQERGFKGVDKSDPLCDVGYCVRFFDNSSSFTKIRYLTDGCLLRECVNGEPADLNRYQAIILDEAHERSVSTDVLFGLLKAIIQRRKDLKVVITSATLDVKKFSTFFGDAPVIKIPGKMYHVEVIYAPPRSFLPADLSPTARVDSNNWMASLKKKKLLEKDEGDKKSNEKKKITRKKGRNYEEDCDDVKEWTPNLLIRHPLGKEFTYFEASLEAILRIHFGEPDGDILCFLTGQDEIDSGCKILDKAVTRLYREDPDMFEDRPDLLILPLYAALAPDEQVKIFEPAPENCRKVILSTNIAETSLTVDGIVYVVDSGYTKLKSYNPQTGMESLDVVRTSRVSADQRKGRAGRTQEGKCYRIYSEYVYNVDGMIAPPNPKTSSKSKVKAEQDVMQAETLPEIKRTNLANTVLSLKAIGVVDVLGFEFLDPPERTTLIDAIKHLYLLEALSTSSGQITPVLGSLMAKFPVEPSLSRVLIEGAELGCAEQMATLVALLSLENLFHRAPPEKEEEVKLSLLRVAVTAQRRSSRRFDDRKRGKRNEDDEVSTDEILWGDHYLLLNIYRAWSDENYSKEFCQEYYIAYNALKEAKQIKQQLTELMEENDLMNRSRDRARTEEIRKEDERTRILRALCSGFFMKTAKMQNMGFLVNNRASLSMQKLVHIHPSSSMFQLELEAKLDWVLYHSLVVTTQGYMRTVSPIKYEWIKESYRRMNDLDMDKLLSMERGSSNQINAGGVDSTIQQQQLQEAQIKNQQLEAQATKAASSNAAIDEARARYLARKGKK